MIGINTVARTGNPDYLLRTLRALRVSGFVLLLRLDLLLLQAAIATFRERRVFVVVACPVNCSTHSGQCTWFATRTIPVILFVVDSMSHLKRNAILFLCCNSWFKVYSAARLEFETDAFMSFLPIAPSQRFMDPTPQAADPGAAHGDLSAIH